MNPNLAHDYRVFIDNKRIDNIKNIQFQSRSQSQLDTLNVTLTSSIASDMDLFGKPIVFFLDKREGIPMFRGFIKDATVNDKSVNIRAIDVRGHLTSENINQLVLDDKYNYDGYTLGGFLKSYIEEYINKETTLIGVDKINDTEPISTLSGVRGTFKPYELVKNRLNLIFDNTKATEQPLRYHMTTVDDGNHSHIKFVKEKLKTDFPILSLSEADGILSYSYKKRPKKFIAHFGNRTFRLGNSKSAAFGKKYNIDEDLSPADAQERVRNLLLSELEENVEITLNTNRGFNLRPEDLVSIQLNNQDIDGVHKVVSKTISISNTCKLSLSLSKHKPMISQFIQ